MRNIPLGLRLSAFALAMSHALSAHGQQTTTTAEDNAAPGDSKASSEQLITIMVTAERNAKPLQKTAVALTVMNGEELQKSGKSALADILEEVPGVVFQTTKPNGAPSISVRGIGTDNSLGNAGVAVFVDGVAINQGALQFFDLERVEVLRGPQGTLYGRGAPAGAINFVTRDPEHHFEAEWSTELGNYSLVHNTGVVNVPLGDDWSARLAVNTIKRAGYFSNDQSDDDERNLRLKLKYRPNRQLSVVLGYDTYRNNSTGEGQVNLDSQGAQHGYLSNAPAGVALFNRDFYKKFTANVNWDLGPALLTYLPSYSNYAQSAASFFGGNANTATGPTNGLVTHELRIANKPVAGGVEWIAGLYSSNAYLHTSTGISNAIFTGNFPVDSNARSRALFGETTLPLAPAWRGTLGLRKSYDKYQTDGANLFDPPQEGQPLIPSSVFPHAEGRFNRLDYKARLETDLGPESLLYASLSTGYRPGGSVQGLVYGQEVNKAFEIGSKNRFWQRRLQINASLYHYAYSGFQQQYQSFENGVPTTNIGSHPATFNGGELEAFARLSKKDDLTFSAAYLSNRYRDSDLPVPHSPRWTLQAGYTRSFALARGGDLKAGFDVKYQGSQYTDYNSPAVAAMFQPAYTLLNAQLGYESADGRFSVNGYVKNATDRLYKLTVNLGAGADAYNTATISPPRTVGVVLSFKM